MASADASALAIQLHPLVVLSLADHYTRELYQNPAGARRCLGLLFGQQDGRTVKVFETVEMAFKETVKGQPQIEQEAVETDMKLFSEAYANYECLGWYASGTGVTPYDYVLHNQLKKYNERPLFVLLNPSLAGPGMRDLPLTVFEEAIHVVGDKTSSEFVKTPYTVQADEAERITVTYCAKVVNQEESGSAVVSHYTTMIKSVQSLRDRVAILHSFLSDVQSGKININAAGDQQILREIKGLCLRLPVMSADKFRSDLLAEYNDALLVTYLSSITKSTQLLADVQDKFSTMHREEGPQFGGRGGGRGMMEDDMMGAMGSVLGRRGGGGRGERGDGFMSSLSSAFGLG